MSTRMNFTWRDKEGKSSQLTVAVYFDNADITSIADAQATFTAYETLLHACSGCHIVAGEVIFPMTTADVENPDDGYNTRSGAILQFKDSNGVGQSLYIPGVLQDKIVNGVIDENDGDITALVNEIIANPGTTDPLSTRGSDSKWSTFEGGRQANRKVS